MCTTCSGSQLHVNYMQGKRGWSSSGYPEWMSEGTGGGRRWHYVNHSLSPTAILHDILYVPVPGLVVSAVVAAVTTVVVVVVVVAVTTVVVVVVVSACPWPSAVLSVQLPPFQSSPQPAEGTQRSNGCADLQPTKKTL